MKKLFLAVAVGCCLSSASAAVYVFDAVLTGANEHNPNSSQGFGYSVVEYDDTANTLTVQALFAGLSGTTIASHIHAATAVPLTGEAGVATTTPTFAGFPLGVTHGLFNSTLDLTMASSYNPSFVAANGGTTAGAQAALVAALFAEKAYLNIHTTEYPGGEIRGFLTLVPEPGSLTLLALGAGAFVLRARSRKS